MKKGMLLVLVAFVLVSLGGLAIAAPDNWYCPYNGQYNKTLTDDQKTQVAAW
ncbi:MAG: hypothetical protein H6Q67_1907 [Firmicutes bacterium]|nr:hypothetical protein [Bacillota bacterium]